MKIIIIGGGETAIALASVLGEDFDITIIEIDEEKAKKIADKTNALVVKGDGTDISFLEETGINDIDAIIIATDDDKTNLMISEIAKNKGIGRIIPLVNSPKNKELFTSAGIRTTVSVVATNVQAITNALRSS